MPRAGRRLAVLTVAAAAAPLLMPGLGADRPAAAQASRRLTIVPAGEETITTIVASYPQKKGVCPAKQRSPVRARYRGTLEISRASDGTLSVVNELPFTDYLAGLGEVPPHWPRETLRAQAIAARTYALYSKANRPRSYRDRGFDICATDQCQVYRGAAAELGAFGERWREAVESTEGRVVTYRGDPIQAFYFSTSTGSTKSNAEVFGGAPRGYLKPVEAHDDASPLARWRSRIRLADLTRILRAAGQWSGGAITSVSTSGGSVRVRGAGGSRSIDVSVFRRRVNSEAPCLFEGRYPPERPDGGRLPQTVPSSTFSATTEGSAVVISGRGWGHDVGMSQYGAKALAERGWDAARILGHYYANTRLETVAEPNPIRVLAIEDAVRIRIEVDGAAAAHTGAGGRIALGAPLLASGGRSLTVERDTGAAPAPVLSIETSAEGAAVEPGTTVTVPFVLNRPARVAPIVTEAGAAAKASGAEETSFERGEGTLQVTLDRPGTYEVVLEAFDGIDRVRTEPVAYTVAAPEPPAGEQEAGRSAPAPLLVGAAAALAAAVATALLRRRGRHAAR